MGADLIGYMAKGPKRFSGAQIKRAEQEARKRAALANAVLNHLDSDLKLPVGPTTLQREVAAKFEAKDPLLELLPCLSENGSGRYATVEEARDAIVELAEASPGDEVGKFASWWYEPSRRARDSVARVFGQEQVVFCGDMSWGDEPEGFGYGTFKRAELFGIPAALGVE
jgi:hypothetical protein